MFLFIADWMESGMDSDISEHLETDEMYLMLQADMVGVNIHFLIRSWLISQHSELYYL